MASEPPTRASALGGVAYLVGAALALAGAIVLATLGVAPSSLPPLAAGGSPVIVHAYSGPLWASSAGAGALAGVLAVCGVVGLWRRRRRSVGESAGTMTP